MGFAAAGVLRHPKTSQWILEKAAFAEFAETSGPEASLLWIYAKPGAGKRSYLLS